jgi:hypothetical protein
MIKPYLRMRVLCAAAAVMLTGLSSTVFVSAAPRELERRISAHALAVSLDRGQAEARVALQPAAQSPAG